MENFYQNNPFSGKKPTLSKLGDIYLYEIYNKGNTT